MSAACFIPIKKTSERLPGKNSRSLDGRPLYQHIIQTVSESEAFDDVYVDTDDDEIKKFCDLVDCGTAVHPIDRDPAMNSANGNQLLCHHWRRHPGYLLYFQIFATAPLIKKQTIEDCVELMKRDGERHDSILTACQRCGWFWFRGQPVNYRPGVLPRSQDAEMVMQETTGLYGITEESLLEYRSRIGGRPMFYLLDDEESVDIDSISDFEHAEFILQARKEGMPSFDPGVEVRR